MQKYYQDLAESGLVGDQESDSDEDFNPIPAPKSRNGHRSSTSSSEKSPGLGDEVKTPAMLTQEPARGEEPFPLPLRQSESVSA
jgi:hypothetical protein